MKRIIQTLPTLLVLALLAALGYWGHHNGWHLPKLSQFRTAAAADKEDWCAEHAVPESRCIACNPELMGGSKADWCKEHGLPESKCTLCHPELKTKGVADDWCAGHGVPESSCTLCNPEIAVKGKVEQTNPLRVIAATQPVKDPKTCQTHAMRVQFASADAVRKAGLKMAAVEERPMSAQISAIGEIEYNRNRLAQVSARSPGVIYRVEREVGQSVKKGDLLALIDCPDAGKARAELLAALASQDVKAKALERIQSSAASGFRTQGDLQVAQAEAVEARLRVGAARQALASLGLAVPADVRPDEAAARFLGLPQAVAAALDPTTAPASLLPLTAPFDGVLIARAVTAGESVDPSRPLFTVADLRQMWVQIDLPLEESRLVQAGQELLFRVDGTSDAAARGRVAYVSTEVDDQTRTVKVRGELDNSEGRLLAKTFGKAAIVIRQSPNAVTVPSEAVQWEGCCNIVFVRMREDVFQPRKVKLGARGAGLTEVLIGVMPGEVVVAEGSRVLTAEILKSALGKGCCD